MEHKSWKTENNEMKKDIKVDKDTEMNKDVRVDLYSTKDEIKKDTKKDTRSNEKKDVRVDLENTNTEVNKDVKEVKSINSPELAYFVKNLHYPAKKQDILDIAMRDGNDSKITSALQMIAEKYYSSADELTRELSTVA